MKILFNLTKSLLVVAIVAMCSCNGNKSERTKAEAPEAGVAVGSMTIRYIDEDSLLSKYNLAKDLNEAMLRRSNQFDAAQQQRANEINKFGSEVQRKYQNNGYLTEESFNVDQQKLNKMQADAQDYLGRLQRDIQNELQQNNIQLNDSINNFLKIYVKEKGIDVVVRKTATFYFDSKYDVTDEVVEGLNKRYTKVEKK